MAKSIKLGSDTYLDASGVTTDSSGTLLSDCIGVWKTLRKTAATDGGNCTFTLGTNTRGVIIVNGYGTNVKALYLVAHSSGASTSIGDVFTSTYLTHTVDSSTGAITITNSNTSNSAYCDLIIFAGTAS